MCQQSVGQPSADQQSVGQLYAGQQSVGQLYAGQLSAGQPNADQQSVGLQSVGQLYAGQPNVEFLPCIESVVLFRVQSVFGMLRGIQIGTNTCILAAQLVV